MTLYFPQSIILKGVFGIRSIVLDLVVAPTVVVPLLLLPFCTHGDGWIEAWSPVDGIVL